MNRAELHQNIIDKQSFLCVGLDPDIKKIPKHLLSESDPIFSFCKEIIDATHEYAVAYKPNLAFFEYLGSRGLESLEKIVEYIPDNCFTIADAKRGDIGNTASMYARTFFEYFDFDAVTVAPYMGEDSVKPFLEFQDKWVILLALTSNKGAFDFQFLESNGKRLFESVIEKSAEWGSPDNLMYVVGATKPEFIADIRKIIPDHFLLVPGVGAQGGNLHDVAHEGLNDHCGLLVNSSRGIIYAGQEKDYALKSNLAAKELQSQMSLLL